MSKITVNETVTRSVSFDNNLVDVQTALDRCFQFLEEERFDEAHVIIEQVLNIEPNNTDAHVANFLYQFKLTCAEDVVKNFKECATYEDSVFYKRVKRGTQTELAKKFLHYFGQAHEKLEQFNTEQERICKEEEQRQKILLEEAQRRAEEERIRREKEEEQRQKVQGEVKRKEEADFIKFEVYACIICLLCALVFVIAYFVNGDSFLLAISSLLLFCSFCFAVTLCFDLDNNRQKQLDQQKTDQAAD